MQWRHNNVDQDIHLLIVWLHKWRDYIDWGEHIVMKVLQQEILLVSIIRMRVSSFFFQINFSFRVVADPFSLI